MSSLSSVPRWQQRPCGPKGWSHLKVEDTKTTPTLLKMASNHQGTTDTLTTALNQSPGNGSGRWQPCWAWGSPVTNRGSQHPREVHNIPNLWPDQLQFIYSFIYLFNPGSLAYGSTTHRTWKVDTTAAADQDQDTEKSPCVFLLFSGPQTKQFFKRPHLHLR